MLSTCGVWHFKCIRSLTAFLVVIFIPNQLLFVKTVNGNNSNNQNNNNRYYSKRRYRHMLDPGKKYRRGAPISVDRNKRRNYFSVDDVIEKERINTSNSNIQHGKTKRFPIDFLRQRGKLEIDFSNDDSTFLNQNYSKTKNRHIFFRRSTKTTDLSSAKVTTPSGKIKNENEIPSALLRKGRDSRRRQIINTNTADVRNKDVRICLSLDPFSLGTLLSNILSTSSIIVPVYVGTLRLLGPMIIAKRCLTTLGYIFYDHYNGRYLRTTYNKRIRYLQEYEVTSAARATGRCLLQILCMGFTGRFVGFVLDRMPCVLKPSWVCYWWYGMVWLMSVYTIGWVCEEWGFNFVTKNNFIHSILSIQPTQIRNDSQKSISKRNILHIPWLFIQRMKDPEEWVKSLIRSSNNESTYPITRLKRRDGKDSIKLDTLLFPSTWRPLIVLTLLAMSRAICVSYTSSSHSTSSNSRQYQYLIMRSFVVQESVYSEWYRVFVKERRIVLGAGISIIGLMSFLWSIYSVANVDRIAAFLLIPALIARLVSGWMNILLYYNRCISPPSLGDT